MQAPPRWARARPPADLAPPKGTTASAAAAAGAARHQQQRRRRSRGAAPSASASFGEAQARQQAAALPLQQQQQNNQQQQQLLRLFYETSWPSAILHGSVNGGPWKDFALTPVASSGGALLVAEVDVGVAAASSSPAPLLEFVVTDPSRQHWDKPPGDDGGNYVVTSAGAAPTTTASFTLRSGALSPVPQTPPGVLLVSDLDGTMIGKHDQETARLKRWWERAQVPRGGVLCFSSGRSLASIRRLLDEDKRGVLAHPDVVVGAVGTRVYWHERATPAAGGGRAGFPTTSSSNGKSGNHGGFVEDARWLAELSSGGWDAPAAREAAYAALARAGKEAMHFLPPEDQSELKVSCGVRDDALAQVLEDLQTGLAKHGASSLAGAQIIVSGHGGWRYVDVVPTRAGKLAALEHVRLSGGFLPGCTVAAGDSGNDVAMLAGGNNLAVVVGNAQPDARAWAEEQQAREREEGGAGLAVAAANGNGNGVRAQQKDRLYRAEKHEAAGILEALEYWGLKEKGEEDG